MSFFPETVQFWLISMDKSKIPPCNNIKLGKTCSTTSGSHSLVNCCAAKGYVNKLNKSINILFFIWIYDFLYFMHNVLRFQHTTTTYFDHAHNHKRHLFTFVEDKSGKVLRYLYHEFHKIPPFTHHHFQPILRTESRYGVRGSYSYDLSMRRLNQPRSAANTSYWKMRAGTMLSHRRLRLVSRLAKMVRDLVVR